MKSLLQILILLVLLLLSSKAKNQELQLNAYKFYEYSIVVDHQNPELMAALKSKILSLNYSLVENADSILIASKSYSMGALTRQKVTNTIRIETLQNRYRVSFSNFLIQVTSPKGITEENPLERQLWKNSWVKHINKELPRLIEELDLNKS